ncbi:MAG: chromosomal replication initiator DnaA [Oceanicaulis sp.]|nr:chromosomal replication initiator DnaA [Oceanicaulis sp.]
MPAQPRAFDLARARLAKQAVSYAFDIPVEEMTGPTRGSARAALARQIAIYLTHVAFEISLARTAEAFGRDRSTAAHACHKVEDRRDDSAFDQCLDELEACLRSVPGPGCARLGHAA